MQTCCVISLFLVLLILFGCKKEEINPNKLNIISEKIIDIVIEGFISTEKTVYQVKLLEPISFTNSESLPINNAKVKLTDGNIVYNFELTSNSGIYESVDSILGEVGKKYTLIVEFNNKTYFASDSLVECKSVIDLPIKNIRTNSDFYNLDIDIHNFGFEHPSIWLEINHTDIEGRIVFYDIKNLYSIKIYNHVGSIAQGIFPPVWDLTGSSGFADDSLEIIKMSVSEAYYEYLLSQFNITEWSSGIFSSIPGNTKTNVSEGGTGFFYCTDIKRFRMTYKDIKALNN